jgi:hypothetical protein
MNITLELQLKELRRELKQRNKVYPRWVASKYLEKAVADYQIRALEEAIKTFEGLIHKAKVSDSPSLFDKELPG